MSAWTFYARSSGLLASWSFDGPSDQLAGNTPTGHAAIPGRFDPLSQRVDISAEPPPDPDPWPVGADGKPLPRVPWYPPVIDYQPPAPANDAWQTWAWDAGIKRWVSQPTLAAIKRDAKQVMAAAWNAAREAGVTVGGKVAPTDAAAWTRYLAIKQMAADGGWTDIPIPLLDGSFHLLTQAQAAALWAALKDMERTLLARLKARVEAIAAASTAAEVNAVTW